MAKLLVVDDEEKIRSMIRKYAEFEGYQIVEAKNGFEAVEKAKNQKFDAGTRRLFRLHRDP